MEAAPDISLLRLLMGFSLLLIPVLMSLLLRMGIIRQLFISVGRMTSQLFLVSILLIYLFEWDNTLINIGWALMMIVFASISSIVNSGLTLKKFFVPVFGAYFVGAGFSLMFFLVVIVNPANIFSAQLLVVAGGMLLGNSLNSVIIGISRYYEGLRKEKKRYHYLLSLGASQQEALQPFLRESVLAALRPFLANMATMGVVFLPGMMTGQILGGASPDVAIKYQVAIMLVIFSSVALSVSLALYFTTRKSFDAFGVLQHNNSR
jgi:putative ABC transport system permease protein